MKDFLTNNYMWFLIIAIILALAMVGYFAEIGKIKSPETPKSKTKPKTDEEFPDLDIKPGMTLGDAVGNQSENKEANVEELIVEEFK